jgi:hypothetical protein
VRKTRTAVGRPGKGSIPATAVCSRGLKEIGAIAEMGRVDWRLESIPGERPGLGQGLLGRVGHYDEEERGRIRFSGCM